MRNVLQRRSVTKKVKNDPTACEDFFLLVAESHILYAVMNVFEMNSLEGAPSNEQFTNFSNLSKDEREKVFNNMIKSVIDRHFNFNKPSSSNDDILSLC